MKLDNVELIKSLLDFKSDDDFYVIEIIQRKKENPGLDANSRCKKEYYLTSIEMLDKIKLELIDLCDLFNARACIRLNKRSFKKCAFENLRKLTDIIYEGNYKAAKNQFSKSAGSSRSNSDKSWIIDIDKEDLINIKEIKDFLNELNPEIIIAEIPSLSGLHVITKPFNRIIFGQKFPNIEIHKDNPTNLII